MTATLPLPQGTVRSAHPRRRFASLRAITALILREMATTYGRSPGGYVWAVLEPVAGIALLSFIFSLTPMSPPLGTNFQLFYASGLVPLTMFTSLSGRVAHSITFSRQLLAYPTVTFMDAILARFLLNFLTQMMVAYLIFAGILLLFDAKVIIQLPYVAAGLALCGVLALGIGTLNCFLFTRYPIWSQLWGIMMRPIFIVSCIFVTFDQMPAWARDWLWYNPIIHLIGMIRHGFYSTYHATYVSAGYVVGLSAVCMLFGVLLLRRFQYTLLQR